ncbi:MAG: cell division ATP-binding protein FtsE [Parcubacteria group bacterium]|nr:cell division ATP-binding protein FtsE [Parcubacteria group bacterium]
MIIFDKVTKIYNGSAPALDNVSLEVKKGDFISIIGPSGAGKSTLLKMLIREDIPTEGRVMVGKVDVAKLSDSEVPVLRRKIGTVFQDFKLLNNKTAFENVAFALEVVGTEQEQIQEDVPRVLKIVGLEERAESFPSQLSGGEKQRVAIARALVHRPEILLADEPTGNLDLLNTYDVIKLLSKINEFGTTVILASHDREVVNTVGKRVISMEKGKIVKEQESGGRYII